MKLSNILPWERDADIAVLSSDFEKLMLYLKGNTLGKLKIRKFRFRTMKNPNIKTSKIFLLLVSLPYLNGTSMTGGSAMINTKSWAVELNGQHELFENDKGTRFVKIFS